MTEYEAGQLVLDRMVNDWGLQVLRLELAQLYRRRVRAALDWPQSGPVYVTADDTRRVMGRLGMTLSNNNKLGATFRTKEWEYAGFDVHSETHGSHGNRLRAWRLRAA